LPISEDERMFAFSLPRLTLAALLSLAFTLAPADVRAATITLPDNAKIDKVDFEQHVMGLFVRLGCSSGSCHGSFQGKGGLRLSLFGYDPSMDFAAVTRESLGRRINPADPDSSLLLLKGAGLTDHGGGRRFSAGSWQWQVLREWIAAGANWEKGSGDVASITITPAEHAYQKAGDTQPLTVVAKFADGREVNVTPFADYRTNNDAVAEVDSLGRVKSLQAGDTAIIVSYRGTVTPVRMLVPMAADPGFKYPAVAEVNFIDTEVFAKLRRLNILPSELSGDTEFLRRVTLDTIGSLPTPEDVRAFVADKDPNKRAKKIDELLAHPLHAALWATKLCDITGNNTDLLENPQQLKPKRSQMWHDWFRKRVQENMPYDEIVKGVLTATSREGKPADEWLNHVKEIEEAIGKGFETKYAERASLDLFWRRQANVPTEQWGEKTAAAFMGIRLECAQCHKHPMDRWTQADYRSYANIFSQLSFGASPDAKKAIDEFNKAQTAAKNNQKFVAKEIFVAAPRGLMTHPDTNATLKPKALGGPEIATEGNKDYRAAMFEWLRAPENPYFSRSFVNRVWGHYFGIGIVQPVDDFSQANPPSNPKLLDALGKEFADKKYDLRHIERIILNSRTYQLSATPNKTNELDRDNFSHAFVRSMMAEVVVDALNTALGVAENFGTDAPPNCRAIEVGASRVQNPVVAQIFRIFGRPVRTSACDCDRAMEPALPQTLFRMTDQSILSKLAAGNGRVQTLLKSKKSDEELLEELFLATLTRFPTDKEKLFFKAYMERKKDRQAAITDTLWALINTREFILNH
jgi:hypothetical protein